MAGVWNSGAASILDDTRHDLGANLQSTIDAIAQKADMIKMTVLCAFIVFVCTVNPLAKSLVALSTMVFDLMLCSSISERI